ncbi:MAG: hypothetical protein MJ101_02365 [Clostridia bacterium]|nr:hypothetical protein [Clostridia bacterium]
MTDREKFHNNTRGITLGLPAYPHKYIRKIRRMIRELRTACTRTKNAIDSECRRYVYDNGKSICAAATAAISAISGNKYPMSGTDPTSVAYFRVMFGLCDGKLTTEYIIDCLDSAKKEYTIAETTHLYDFYILALFEMIYESYISDDNCMSGLFSLYFIRGSIAFDEIYVRLASVHKVYLKEKADVYRNCSTDTIRMYDELTRHYAAARKITEIEAAVRILTEADVKKAHIGEILLVENNDTAVQFVISAVLLFVVLLCSMIALNAGTLIVLLLLLPLYRYSRDIICRAFSDERKRLPRLKECDVVRQTKCIVAVSAVLDSAKTVIALTDRLEDMYITNRHANVVYLLLADLPDSDTAKAVFDDDVTDTARRRIKALNTKYGGGFSVMIRERVYTECEGKFIGYERKRGAILELCRAVKNDRKTTFCDWTDYDCLSGAEYILALDSDTDLYSGAVYDLLRVACHPCNRAKLGDCGVLSGYGIIRPILSVSNRSANATAFSRLTAGKPYNRYTANAFDLYHDVFGRGSFCGKGIIDINAYTAVCDGFFPEQRILSHDILEGELMKTAVDSSVVLTDSTPARSMSYFARLSRWIRGDTQALMYLRPKVKNSVGKVIMNPLDTLSKIKLTDGITESLSQALTLTVFFIGLYTGNFAATIIPMIISLKNALSELLSAQGENGIFSLNRLIKCLVNDIYCVLTGTYTIVLSLTTIVNTIYRIASGNRHMLQWKTSSQADRLFGDSRFPLYITTYFPSCVLGAVAAASANPVGIAVGILWIACPLTLFCLDTMRVSKRYPDKEDKCVLKSYSRDMWMYFRDNVSSGGLPPDNVEFCNGKRTAHMTSPTNIGMYILSMLGARDIGLISDSELLFLAQRTLTSVDGMDKWHGCLYNWYDTDNGTVVSRFVSSVDNGNLFAALSVCAEGVTDYNSSGMFDGIISQAVKLRDRMDLRSLYDGRSDLFYIGFNADTGEYTSSHYDILMSEARILIYFAVAFGLVPAKCYSKLARNVIAGSHCKGIYSWSGTAFEYLMPSMILPMYAGSVERNAVEYAIKNNITAMRGLSDNGVKLCGVSESCYYRFDSKMTYQYRAFGQKALSLDPGQNGDDVYSPYSVFLMMNVSATGKLNLLHQYKKIGAYGKYGFYDAVDATSARTGRGYAVIKTFMTHHIGMSFISCVNAMQNNRFVSRAERIPDIRAFLYLLDESMPDGINPYPAEKRDTDSYKRLLLSDSEDQITSGVRKHIAPVGAVLTNGTTCFYSDKSGHMQINTGKTEWFDCRMSSCGFTDSMTVFADIDGINIPLFPYLNSDENSTSSFEFIPRRNSVKYVSHNRVGGREITASVTFSLGTDDELRIECAARGKFGYCSFRLYFIPVIDDIRAYRAHKSFSDLFIIGRYDAEDNSFIFCRRNTEGKNVPNILRVRCDKTDDPMRISCDLSESLPLKYTVDDIFGARLSKVNGERPCILPCCILQSKKLSSDEPNVTFTLGCEINGRDPERNTAVSHMTDHLAYDCGLDASSHGIASLMIYGKLNGAHFSAFEPLSKPTDICNLWQYGISGDDPIMACVYDGGTHQPQRLFNLLRVFSFLTLSGFRIDFVILVRENDVYNSPLRHEISDLIEYAGLSAFVKTEKGIHQIPDSDMNREMISTIGTVFVDLNISLKKAVFGFNRDIPTKSYPTPFIRRLPGNGEYKAGNGIVSFEKGHKNPWAHVIAHNSFGTVLTENSLGFTYAQNASLCKLTPHDADGYREDDGELLLMRIFGDGRYADFDMIASASSVTYGDMFAEYKGKIDGKSYTVTVDLCGLLPVKRVRVRLDENYVNVKTIYLIRPCPGDSHSDEFIVNKYKNAAYATPAIYHGRMPGTALICDRSADVITDRRCLLSNGEYDGRRHDIVALSTTQCEKDCSFYLAAVRTNVFLSYLLHADGLCDIGRRTAYSDSRILLFDCDKKLSDAVNHWYYYQTKVSRIYARSGYYQVSGAYGFRDQLQDVLSLTFEDADIARTHILRAASHQYTDGTVAHWWHTDGRKVMALHSRFADDPFWLVFVTCKYIEITDDVNILKVRLPYLSSEPLTNCEVDRYETVGFSSERDSLLDHLKLAMRSTDKTGQYGLMLFGGGDWNDGMNRAGINGKGQSVWLTFFAAVTASLMARLADRLGDVGYGRHLRSRCERLLNSAERCAFAGDRWLRGFTDDGTQFCPSESDGGMDIMAQAFSVFAYHECGILSSDKVRAALDSAYRELVDVNYGIVRLLYPPFAADRTDIGYIASYPDGVRENGGQYNHAAVFAAIAYFIDGGHERGAEILKWLNPAIRHDGDTYRIEPYVIAGDVYTADGIYGRGGWSWYTGAAGWYRIAVINILCGITFEGNKMFVAPRLSDAFPSFSVIIKRGLTEYSVTCRLGSVDSCVLDGKSCSSDCFMLDGCHHSLDICISRLTPTANYDKITSGD